MNINIIREEDFTEQIHTVIADFRKEHVTEGEFTSWDGTVLHYYMAHHPKAKGTIVISHGFCEFFGKYHEVSYYFYEMGYSFFFLDHRGHGYSERKVPEWDKVYVKDYQEYVEDFRCFMEQIVLPEMKKHGEAQEKLYIFAHSMGGAIATLFLEQYPGYFKAAVLSSPLMEMNVGKYPTFLVRILMGWAKLAGWDYQYVPGQKGFDRIPVFPTSSTLSLPRYEYVFQQRLENPHFQTYGGCYAWTRASLKATRQVIKQAEKIEVPVLLLEAGRDTMVKNEGHIRFCKKAKNVRFITYDDAKHEIFNALQATIDKYYEDVFGFLEEQGAASI